LLGLNFLSDFESSKQYRSAALTLFTTDAGGNFLSFPSLHIPLFSALLFGSGQGRTLTDTCESRGKK
jgi:hypothetical protein